MFLQTQCYRYDANSNFSKDKNFKRSANNTKLLGNDIFFVFLASLNKFGFLWTFYSSAWKFLWYISSNVVLLCFLEPHGVCHTFPILAGQNSANESSHQQVPAVLVKCSFWAVKLITNVFASAGFHLPDVFKAVFCVLDGTEGTGETEVCFQQFFAAF